MPPRNRAKLGLTIPVDPRSRGFEAFYDNNPLTWPPSSSSGAPLPSPSRRNVARSPRPQPSPRTQPSPRPIPAPPPAPIRRMQQAAKKAVTAAKAKLEKEEVEELENLVHTKSNRKLSKQLSMRETARDVAWEKRRRQISRQERRRNSISVESTSTPDIASQAQMAGAADGDRLTDADLDELKGSIELGFGFNEEAGQRLCNTLPALDLYFAVNRQVSLSPVTTPRQATAPPLDSPGSDDSWRICGPGDDPREVKTKLRHWAQAVACSIMQSF